MLVGLLSLSACAAERRGVGKLLLLNTLRAYTFSLAQLFHTQVHLPPNQELGCVCARPPTPNP